MAAVSGSHDESMCPIMEPKIAFFEEGEADEVDNGSVETSKTTELCSLHSLATNEWIRKGVTQSGLTYVLINIALLHIETALPQAFWSRLVIVWASFVLGAIGLIAAAVEMVFRLLFAIGVGVTSLFYTGQKRDDLLSISRDLFWSLIKPSISNLSVLRTLVIAMKRKKFDALKLLLEKSLNHVKGASNEEALEVLKKALKIDSIINGNGMILSMFSFMTLPFETTFRMVDEACQGGVDNTSGIAAQLDELSAQVPVESAAPDTPEV